MDNNNHDKLKKLSNLFKKTENKTKIFVAVGIISVLLIALSEAIPSSDSAGSGNDSSDLYSEYTQSLEEKTEDMLSSVDGVGKCRVMITLKNSDENVYAQNYNSATSDDSQTSSNEYVFSDGDNGNEPVTLKTYFPTVQGVAVVCEGADDDTIKENIINSVCSLYDISSSKITVTKLKTGR